MVERNFTAQAIAAGRKSAKVVLKRRAAVRAKRDRALTKYVGRLDFQTKVTSYERLVGAASVSTVGFLVAAGDSWFNYPLHSDVLDLLEDDYFYTVESVAHYGDAIEAMAYRDGQLDKLARCIDKVRARGAVPKAILLSGGGNDIAGREFGMLLNNATSELAGWNDEIVDGVLNHRVMVAFKFMLAKIDFLCRGAFKKSLPVLVHGYDYPVPDGRGFLGILAGPWLQPGFREKLFKDLVTNTKLMRSVIDRFNTMLNELAKEPAFNYVRYVDLRNTLSGELARGAYQKWWDNELHPTEPGFRAVAAKFATVLSKVI